jgi:beta-mannosidase
VLRFEGLDTVCQVFLNDECIAEHDNMFVPLEIDVTRRLVLGKNRIRVEFTSARREGERRRARYFEAQGIDPKTVRFDARAFVRKAQYMYGWDWGPSLISAGIYRPVSLIEHRGRLLDVHIEQRHHENGSVEIRCTSTSDGITESNAAVYHAIEGFDGLLADGEWFRIEHPRLWWPNGMGEPALYRVSSFLCVGEPRSRLDCEAALDVKEQRIGLREVTLRRDEDAHGRSFRFVINGQETYVLGANFIPDDSFVSRVDPKRLRAQLERAVDLNMNCLRVWGGGFYESEAFYDGCDELGLMVWQDFPYACSYYPDDEVACRVAFDEAAVNVRRLRNRASLVLWCGNNENHTMREDRWDGADLQPVRYEGERIYAEVLPRVLTELDPGRPYIPSSPFGDGRANSGRDGDQHYWDVWHGRGDWVHYRDSDARFCSEFGFASAPGQEALRAMDPSRNLLEADVRDPVARWHDKTAKGHETFMRFVALHYPMSRTIEEWAYYSQLNQRDALRFGIEHFRRGERCRGTLVWQLNDCWPVQSWAVVDSSFRYKAAAFELRRLYAPLLSSLERVDGVLRLWGILDNVAKSRTTAFDLRVHALRTGELLAAKDATTTLRPGERKVVLEIPVPERDPSDVAVCTRVGGQTYFALLVDPKDVVFSRPAPLVIDVRRDVLAVRTTTPIWDLCLWDESGTLELLDNFLSYVGPGPGIVEFRYRGTPTKISARSVSGRHEVRLR